MMPTPGLSLVGFLDQQHAIAFLANACVPADPNPVALSAEWTAARTKLGPAFVNPGNPRISSIDARHTQHLQQVAHHAAFQPGGILHGVTFQNIEIDPLLAYQFNVDSDRSDAHCRHISRPPTEEELLNFCLPANPISEDIKPTIGQNSLLLRARSLNVKTFNAGIFNGEFIGIQFGVTLPYVHVVRYQGLCFLHNGYHRVVGARQRGATEVPCIFRDVATAEEAGIRSDGSTFTEQVLRGHNPPTLAHFTQGRAYDVAVRAYSRLMHVSWSEYSVPDE